ncbi:MAG: SUMF1/EgtB/PvdO family nonheme iron enzyme [Cyanobacteria bacterium REEB459]|nr:SUMF1/EgtB/PvdO family nonheme iron enzyme [Cyanobacteria bacterium REEB459]
MKARGRSAHLVRGGSWYNNPVNCRSANRNRNNPNNRNNNIGFRVVCAPPALLSARASQ